MKYTRHVAGEYNPDTRLQACVICGLILTDHRNAMWPKGQEPPKGLPAGVIFRSGGNPIITTLELDSTETYQPCTP